MALPIRTLRPACSQSSKLCQRRSFTGLTPLNTSNLHRQQPCTKRSVRSKTCSSRPTSRSCPLRSDLQERNYHSYDTPPSPPYPPHESAILSAALSHVPSHGFTTTALQLGARDAGYLDASVNLFPRGAFELILYHLATRRLALKESVQFPDATGGKEGTKKPLGVGGKVRLLTLERLRANKPVIHQWQEALAVMAIPSNAYPSLRELLHLADEIFYLAGDTSVDSSWYTKRLSLASVYAAADVFMTQDASPGFADTERFLDARLEDVKAAGTAVNELGDWLGFQGHSLVNLLRSKGVRI